MSVVRLTSFHMSSKQHLWREDIGDNTSRDHYHHHHHLVLFSLSTSALVQIERPFYNSLVDFKSKCVDIKITQVQYVQCNAESRKNICACAILQIFLQELHYIACVLVNSCTGVQLDYVQLTLFVSRFNISIIHHFFHPF